MTLEVEKLLELDFNEKKLDFYDMVLRSEGVEEPGLIELRARLDDALKNGHERIVFKTLMANIDKLPLFQYGLGYDKIGGWNKVLIEEAVKADSFFGLLSLRLLSVDLEPSLSETPILRMIKERKYCAACALVIPISESNQAQIVRELSPKWWELYDLLEKNGPQYVFWQLVNAVEALADKDAYEKTITQNFGEKANYFRAQSMAFNMQGWLGNVAAQCFSQAYDDDEEEDEELGKEYEDDED